MKNFVSKLKQYDVNFETDTSIIKRLYYEFVEELKQKYGELNTSFDDNKIIRRGNEWLDIHHICEFDGDGINGLDDIAT